MPLEMEQRTQEGVQILDLKGRLTFGEEDLALRQKLDQLVREKQTKVVLGMEGLREVDTTGMETLLFANEILRSAGGGLALAGLQPSHIEAIMKAKLEVILQIFADDQDAVNSFIPGRRVAHYDVLEFVRSLGTGNEGETPKREE